MRPRVLLLLLLTIAAQKIWAQQYPLYRYSEEEGLSHANVYRITQDEKGFLWFSTNFGLSRFDGRRFLNYHTSDGLGSNMVLSMSEDRQGQKWVGTFGSGLSVLNQTGRFNPAAYNNSLPKNILFSEEWRDARWIIGTDTVRTLFLERNGSVKRFLLPGRSGHCVTFYKMVRWKDAIYFLTDGGIYQADASYQLVPFLTEIASGKVTDMQVAGAGDFWIGKEGEILHVVQNKLQESFPLKGDEVTDMQLDRHGRLWISAADEGILLIEQHQLRNLSANVSIGNVLINDIFEDREGNIWFATHGEGVFRLNSLDFVRYGIEKRLMNAYCKALAPYGGDVYIGSFGNVSLWHEGKLQPVPIPDVKRHVFIYFIRIIDGELYIGTPFGLLRKRIGADAGTMLNPRKSSVGTLCMCRDAAGKIWLGSYSDLYWLNVDFLEKVTDGHPPTGKRINAVWADKTGTLWLGTEAGIYLRQGQADFQQLAAEGLGAVNSIYEDSASGDIWFAADNALAVYRNTKLTIVAKAQNTSPEKFNTITGDTAGNIWAGSINGLLRIAPKTLTVREYKTDLGEVLSIYCAGEQLFLGTVNGLSLIRPSGVDDKQAPVVYITAAVTDTAQIYFPQSLRLPYRANKLRLEFSGLYFRFPKSVDYRYKIEGLDSNWRLTGNTSIEVPALPPGTFRFVVSARKNGGVWGKAAVLPITVATPLWRQPWIIGLSALLGLLLLYLIIRALVGRIERRKRRQLLLFNKMLYLKQQALGALINPHFIFNAMNSIQHYLNRADNKKANKYLADFAGLIRLTLQHAQDAFIALDTEVARLQLYLSLEQLRTGPDLQFRIELDEQLKHRQCLIPNMVLQPYVENAIWHGIIPKDAPGMLLIRCALSEPSIITVEISDDGVGYSEEAAKGKPGSLGMSLTAERLELLQRLFDKTYTVSVRTLKDANGKAAGTTVKLVLPCLSSQQEWEALEKGYAG